MPLETVKVESKEGKKQKKKKTQKRRITGSGSKIQKFVTDVAHEIKADNLKGMSGASRFLIDKYGERIMKIWVGNMNPKESLDAINVKM